MNTIINFKTDKDTKEKAQKIAKQMGLNLSSILNASLHQFVRTKKIYIHLNNEIPSDVLIETVKQGEEELKRGDVSPSFTNAEDAIRWLHSKSRKYGN